MDFLPASALKVSLGAVSHAWLACSLPALLLAAAFAPIGASAETRPDGRELAEVGAARDFIRFAAVGGPRKVCDRVRSWDPRFVIAPGAGSYPAGGAEVLCPPLEAGHYDAPRGPVHLFFLSGDSAAADRGGRDGSQARWLRKALADSPAAWKIVYLLNAPYSSAASQASQTRKALRWPLKEWGADAVMSGRDGGYERLRIDGLTFFVNGPELGRSPAEDARLPGSECVFDEDAGALLIEADGQRIDFRYITAEGLVVDAHTLRKPYPAGAPAAAPAAARR